MQAMAALQSSQALEQENPLWVDEGSALQRTLDDPTNADNRQLFFAKVLRSATDDEVRRLFSRFGRVTDVNLFRAFQGAPTTKGCGLVTMGSHAEAVAAIAALDSKFVWEGMETPMVVKWMDMALQRRRRELHLANLRQSLATGGGMGLMSGGLSLATTAPLPPSLGLQHGSFLDTLEPTETPPPGCSPDAIKLFVGNVPKSCTEEQLLPLFQSVGKVVELVIVHDKVTHESKGSAFVWYATRTDAERAILQFNFRHVLPDPSGDQDRPLVVRRAKMRAKPVKQPGALTLGALTPVQLQSTVMSSLPGLGTGASAGTGHTLYKPASMQPSAGTLGLSGLEALQLNDAGGLVAAAGLTGLQHVQTGHGGAAGLDTGLGVGGLGLGGALPYRSLGGLAGLQSTMQTGVFDALGTGSSDDFQLYGDLAMAQQLHQAAAASSLDALQPLGLGIGLPSAAVARSAAPQLTHSLTLNQQQLSVLNMHLFSVQTVSGAQLHISPGAPGLFNLLVSGTPGQVETARGLVATVLSHA